MKTRFVALLTLFLCVNIGYAQVKIGENPDIIDPASLVELESSDKAFILTRVDDVQMSAMAPLNGALVFNTTSQCVHYYDGSQWNNLCAANSGFSFSDNGDGTFTLDDGVGGSITWNGAPETVTTLVDNLDGTYTYTNEEGTMVTITPGLDDQNLTGVGFNPATGELTIGIEDGNTTTTDLSDLDESAEVTTNATNIATNTTDIATNTTDIATNTTDISAHVAADGDLNSTNEIQSLTSTDASVTLTQTGDDYDLSVPVADGSETVVTAGTDINVTGTGTSGDPYIVNSTFTEVDGDITNEIQSLTSTDASVTLTQTGDDYDLSVPVADGSETVVTGAGINAVTGTGTSGDPYVVTGTEVDGDITNEIQSLTSTDASVTLTQTGDDYDLSVPVADGSETVVTGAGINAVTGTGTSGDPYVVTGTEVDGDINNEINTAFALTGTTLEVTDAAGTLSQDLDGTFATDVELNAHITADGDLDATNEIQSLTSTDASVTLTQTGDDYDLSVPVADGSETVVTAGTDINVTGIGTSLDPYIVNSTFAEVDGDITNEIQSLTSTDASVTLTQTGDDYDLSVPVADGSETVVTAGTDINVTGTGTSGDPYIVNSTFTEVDGDITNEIQSLTSTDASVTLTQTGDDYDLSVPVADGSETVVTGAGINAVTGTGTAGDPYVVTGTEVDGDINNEINTAFALTGTTLEVTDAAGTLSQDLDGTFATDVELNAHITADGDLDATNEIQSLTSTDASVTLTQTGDDYDLSVPVADGSETVVTGAGINAVTGTGTSGDPYVVTGTEIDGDINNEVNTAFALTGTTLEVTDAAGTLSQDLDGTFATDVELNAHITADGDLDATNEIQSLTSTDASVTLTQTGDDYDLSVPVADGSETVVTGAGINAVTGTGTSGDPYVVTGTEIDGDINNEVNTAFALTGTTLEVTDAAGTLSQDLDGTFATDVELNAHITADGDLDATNEIQSLTSTDASVTLTQTGDDYDLSVPVADGSETVVTGSGINAVTGTGTSGDPYVVTGTEVDGDITNEIQSLTSTDASVTLTQTGDDYDLSVPIADGSETVVTGAGINAVTGTGTSGDPYVVTGTEVDGDITNEIQTLSKAGTTITLSDGGGSVDETVTTLAQNTGTGVITYTNESGTNQTANVVSTDADNSISAGSDGGAYFGAYEKIVIWAEEESELSSNTLEWSYGNNATGLIGIPLPEAWEAYAVSFNADINGGSDTVTMAVINAATNTNLFTFTASGAANNMVYTEVLATPVAIPAGTAIGFRTVTEAGDVEDARVAVFLRRRP